MVVISFSARATGGKAAGAQAHKNSRLTHCSDQNQGYFLLDRRRGGNYEEFGPDAGNFVRAREPF